MCSVFYMLLGWRLSFPQGAADWKHKKLLWFLGFEQISQAECTRDVGAGQQGTMNRAMLTGGQWSAVTGSAAGNPAGRGIISA